MLDLLSPDFVQPDGTLNWKIERAYMRNCTSGSIRGYAV